MNRESECTCPYIMIGSTRSDARNWSETCPEHGVGTEYARAHPPPYGYADVWDWSRDRFLEWLASNDE
jgi:hypothetical protein